MGYSQQSEKQSNRVSFNLTHIVNFLYNERVSDIDNAIQIAAKAHKNQLDRFGRPYILHPIRMLFNVESENEQIVALLHDVVEKSEWTFEDLITEGFSQEIVEAVKCLTKNDEESYPDYIKRVAPNELSRNVKLADLEDHFESMIKFGIMEKEPKRAARYKEAMYALKAHSLLLD